MSPQMIIMNMKVMKRIVKAHHKKRVLNIVQKISVTPGLNGSVGIVKNVTNMVSEENSVTENFLPIIHHPTPYRAVIPLYMKLGGTSPRKCPMGIFQSYTVNYISLCCHSQCSREDVPPNFIYKGMTARCVTPNLS